MKIFLSVISIGFAVWGLNALYHDTEPKPFHFWNNYGFEVGKTVIVVDNYTNPFYTKRPNDTLVVKAIKGDYVQFTNGRVERFASFGMGCYDWKQLK